MLGSNIMKSHVKALVVGGGAVGTSIAYHLAKAGWQNVMLLERDELTSGSTWHAAGLLPLFNMSYATTHIHKYSVDFYKTLEAETGLNAGFQLLATCVWRKLKIEWMSICFTRPRQKLVKSHTNGLHPMKSKNAGHL